MAVTTEDNYNRCAVHLRQKMTIDMEQNQCTDHMYQHKRTKTVSDNEYAFYFATKWGLPKLESSQELWVQTLNIQYGNGAAIVVRAC